MEYIDRNRYFIVSFSLNNDKIHGFGQRDFVTNGCYLNMQKTTEQIKSELEYENVGIVILNVIELSESDYNDWSCKKQN